LGSLASGTRQQLLRVASAGLEREIKGPTKHGGEERLVGDPRTTRADKKPTKLRTHMNGIITSKKAAIDTKKALHTGVVSTTHSNDVVLNFN